MRPFDRVVLVVLDSLGIGAQPDAPDWGDAGRDTLGHIAERYRLNIPNFARLGLANIRPLADVEPVAQPEGAYGKATLLSAGKDTTAGHWEMAGVILDRPFPTYPHGFPRSLMDRFEQAFWSGQSIEELYRALSAKPTQSMAACFVAAMREWKRSFESQARSVAGLQMRIEKVMNVSIAREVERLERRLLVLATVGSAGPFVGLFGTVWGIMSSFQSIAASKNTSLAVVAPGIAEALFATAIGLIAAIPATIFYNKFTSEVNRQAQRLEGFADEFSAILSRQIDERG